LATLRAKERGHKKVKKVLVVHRDGLPYRLIGRYVGLPKYTVVQSVRRGACTGPQPIQPAN
jgi:hypothetical protein